MGHLLHREGYHEECILCFEESAAIDAANAEVLVSLAAVFLEQSNLIGAVCCLKKVGTGGNDREAALCVSALERIIGAALLHDECLLSYTRVYSGSPPTYETTRMSALAVDFASSCVEVYRFIAKMSIP